MPKNSQNLNLNSLRSHANCKGKIKLLKILTNLTSDKSSKKKLKDATNHLEKSKDIIQLQKENPPRSNLKKNLKNNNLMGNTMEHSQSLKLVMQKDKLLS